MVNVALVDLAIERVASVPGLTAVAVNVCHGREQLVAHLRRPGAPPVHVSVEDPEPLGTAGAIAHLRDWLDGRGALVVNGDTWCPAALEVLVRDWDGDRVRVLVTGDPPLHGRSGIVGSLVPWAEVVALPPGPAGLWEVLWRDRLAAGVLESIGWHGPFVDCASPADYLRANLDALRHRGLTSLVDPTAVIAADATVGPGCVVGAGVTVAGAIERTVLWPDATVRAGEVLVDAIRTGRGTTVLVR